MRRFAIYALLQALTEVALSVPVASVHSNNVLEGMLSFTGRSQLAGFETANGTRLAAWVETTQGKDNIFVAKARNTGGFSAAYPVTNFTEDDGSSIALFGFFSESVLHFSRRATSDANPSHYRIPHDGGFYAASTDKVLSVDFITSMPVSSVANGVAYWATSVPRIGVPAGNLGSRKYNAAALVSAPLAANGRSLLSPGENPIIILSTKHGSIDDFTFSPDHSIVAIVNNRGDHGFIGLFSLTNGTVIHWIAPTHDTDVAPTWSPVGNKIAWRREYSMLGENARDVRCLNHGYCGDAAGPAYAIMVADVAIDNIRATVTSGNVSELHRDVTFGYPDSSAGYGSRGIHWQSAGGHVVFACENSGFMQVCAAPADGRSTSRVVSSASCDTQAYIVVGDFVYMTHNCDLVDSLGIARVSILGETGVVSVVKATATTVSGMSASGGNLVVFGASGVATMGSRSKQAVRATLVFFQTTWNTSASVVACIDDDGGTDSVRRPDGVNAYASCHSTKLQALSKTRRLFGLHSTASVPQLVQPKLVTFPSLDGTLLHAQLFEPPAVSSVGAHRTNTGGSNAAASGVIFTHGGCQRQMYAAYHYDNTYAALYALNQYLATEGHTVLSVNYRGGPGYGVKFRAANNSGWQGASEYQDVLAGALWLRQHVGTDAIGIHGLSYGGLNAMQAVSRNSDVFKASVANAPVVNWISELRYDEDYVYGAGAPFDLLGRPGNPLFRALPIEPSTDRANPNWLSHSQTNQELAWKSSPAAYLDNISSPLLLIQGDSDSEVDFEETLGVARALRLRGYKGFSSLVFPDETHGLSRFENQLTAAQATADFLTKHLQMP
eukprot:m.754396 g.754396  ORF g.754396 m.754396 type:complete len:837 (-) comp23175_c0_seq31:333-2843(-)